MLRHKYYLAINLINQDLILKKETKLMAFIDMEIIIVVNRFDE